MDSIVSLILKDDGKVLCFALFTLKAANQVIIGKIKKHRLWAIFICTT